MAGSYSNLGEAASSPLLGAIGWYAGLTFPHRPAKVLRKLRDKVTASGGRGPSAATAIRRVDRRLGADKVAEIISAYEAGGTARSIAAEHGVSQTALIQLLRESGVRIRRQPISDEQLAEITEMYESGASIYAIASKTGIPKSTVGRALNDAGVQMRARGGRASSVRMRTA